VQQVANIAPSGPSGSGPDVRPAVMDPAYANLDTDGLSPLPGAAGGETANTDYVEHKPAKRSAYKDSDLKRVMEICRGC
jgi:hypothetical protein